MNYIKRKTPIKRMGKKGYEWMKARERLKGEYLERGIVTCEVQLPGCWKHEALSFAHRYKRTDPRCEHTFEQTLLCCVPCHDQIEYDKELTEALFKRLRP